MSDIRTDRLLIVVVWMTLLTSLPTSSLDDDDDDDDDEGEGEEEDDDCRSL